MIAKVTRGRGFSGLLSYLLTGSDGRQPDRVGWLAGRNLFTGDTALIPSVMQATASQNAAVEKPVYHLTISLDPAEKLDRRTLEGVVDTTPRDLGLDQHQALLVAHRDTAHQHVHVMINRVHPETGKAWHPGHDYARIERSLRRQERALGLRQVPGRHSPVAGEGRYRGAGASSGDRRLTARTAQPPFAEHVRAVVRRDMLDAASWEALHQRLGELGLRLQKRGRGLALTDGERHVKASFVDRRASLGHLERRLGPYRPPALDFPAGKSERWGRIQDLRNAIEGLTLDGEARRRRRSQRLRGLSAERQARRIEHRLEAVSATFDARLHQVYRDPRRARRAFDAAAEKGLGAKPHRTLARRPKAFGKLRGGGGPLSTAERWAAREAVPGAAAAGRDLLAARDALKRSLTGTAKPRPVAVRRTTAPTRRVLEQTAKRLARRLGWRLAARIMTAPQFQLLRLTAGLGRGILEVSRGTERGERR